jgi:hypothetical protein
MEGFALSRQYDSMIMDITNTIPAVNNQNGLFSEIVKNTFGEIRTASSLEI